VRFFELLAKTKKLAKLVSRFGVRKRVVRVQGCVSALQRLPIFTSPLKQNIQLGHGCIEEVENSFWFSPGLSCMPKGSLRNPMPTVYVENEQMYIICLEYIVTVLAKMKFIGPSGVKRISEFLICLATGI